ncbi:hypothetical protein [Sorangium cellulosum]|nr:hypothetical protein [Sorangium cellulosum]
MSPALRRHIAQLLHRLMAMAVFPCRLVAMNALPRGFLPKLGPAKAKACLYPDGDARLLAYSAIPLWWRVLWGFLNREGPRISEAARLQVQDVDLDRGALRLEKNKTNDPRARVLQVRAHDTRSTFITVALANGRSETWVADRTGHRSSVMIQRTRRAARTFAELGLGELASLA